MKKYKVEVDMTITAYIEVEARDEIEANDMARDTVREKDLDDFKIWSEDVSIKNEEYIWTSEDMDKWEKVWYNPDDYTSEEDVNLAIANEDIIFISDDRRGAYEAFCDDGFAELDELRANGITPSFNWFCSELDKGYHESGCIEIARLIETSNGIFYDKEYV